MNAPAIQMVPQQIYVAPVAYTPQLPVRFTVRGRPGVRLRDACNGQLDYLDNRHDVHTINALRIGIRILWPGYLPWESRNMSVVDASAHAKVHTMEKLLNTLANKILQFYREMSQSHIINPDQASWALPNIDFDRLYITELRHVSQGSWQPILFYA